MIFYARYDVDLKAMRKRVNKKGVYKKQYLTLLNKLLDIMDDGRIADAYEFYCSKAWDVDGHPREFLDIDMADLFQMISFGYHVRPKGARVLSEKLPEPGKLFARRVLIEQEVLHMKCKCGRQETMFGHHAADTKANQPLDLREIVPIDGWGSWKYKCKTVKGKPHYYDVTCPTCNEIGRAHV